MCAGVHTLGAALLAVALSRPRALSGSSRLVEQVLLLEVHVGHMCTMSTSLGSTSGRLHQQEQQLGPQQQAVGGAGAGANKEAVTGIEAEAAQCALLAALHLDRAMTLKEQRQQGAAAARQGPGHQGAGAQGVEGPAGGRGRGAGHGQAGVGGGRGRGRGRAGGGGPAAAVVPAVAAAEGGADTDREDAAAAAGGAGGGGMAQAGEQHLSRARELLQRLLAASVLMVVEAGGCGPCGAAGSLEEKGGLPLGLPALEEAGGAAEGTAGGVDAEGASCSSGSDGGVVAAQRRLAGCRRRHGAAMALYHWLTGHLQEAEGQVRSGIAAGLPGF